MNQDITNINPNDHTRITEGSAVALHFKVSLEDGSELDSTFGRDNPVNLVIGDGNLLLGFENTLMGLRAGDKRTASLSPAEAFGEWNPDNLQVFDKNQFAAISPINGDNSSTTIGSMIEFADKGNNTLAGVVYAITEDEVTVDFNHPLAGKTVIFTVEIFSVTPPNSAPVKLI